VKIIKSHSDEEKELERVNEAIKTVELEYSEVLLEFNTLTNEISSFRNRYYLRVGVLYARLDSLDAEIKKILSKIDTDNERLASEAEEARRKAEETEEEVNRADEDVPAKFSPSSSIKKMYRKISLMLHPDRAKEAEDKRLRNFLMTQLNTAYEACDEKAMNEILTRYTLELDGVGLDIVDVQVSKALQILSSISTKMENMEIQIELLNSSEWMELKLKIESDEGEGKDALGLLAEEVYEKISTKQAELNKLLKEGVSIDENSDGPIENVSEDATARGAKHESVSQFRPEGLIHRTMRGEKVRSKSEAIIANILFGMGLDYRYEYPIEGTIASGVRRPDFVFFNKAGSPIIWEHLGMLDNAEYAERWKQKLNWYEENGFVENVSLYVTVDHYKEGFDSQGILEMAKKVQETVAQ
jgi:archaellum component FlaC